MRMQSGKLIKEYMRDGRRRPVGLFVAYAEGDTVKIGFSKCNTKYDTFDKGLANRIALNRAIKGTKRSWDEIPNDVKFEVVDFAKRCKRYFKDKSKIEFVGLVDFT